MDPKARFGKSFRSTLRGILPGDIQAYKKIIIFAALTDVEFKE
jgi:hypothetical protein